ncbi:hypothetical protein [Parasphingorhabdus sp.]|uniref:hypothetical protein n=1 Tax=Parasphingorhabdus sp. TaxID=2709688 RepID=UPI003A8EE2FB
MTERAEYNGFAMAGTRSTQDFTERAIFIFCDLCPATPKIRDFSKVNALPSVTFKIANREAIANGEREAEQNHRNAEHKRADLL